MSVLFCVSYNCGEKQASKKKKILDKYLKRFKPKCCQSNIIRRVIDYFRYSNWNWKGLNGSTKI